MYKYILMSFVSLIKGHVVFTDPAVGDLFFHFKNMHANFVFVSPQTPDSETGSVKCQACGCEKVITVEEVRINMRLY